MTANNIQTIYAALLYIKQAADGQQVAWRCQQAQLPPSWPLVQQRAVCGHRPTTILPYAYDTPRSTGLPLLSGASQVVHGTAALSVKGWVADKGFGWEARCCRNTDNDDKNFDVYLNALPMGCPTHGPNADFGKDCLSDQIIKTFAMHDLIYACSSVTVLHREPPEWITLARLFRGLSNHI